MTEADLYSRSLQRLRDHLAILADKPEESAQSTLDALWFAASGERLSVEKASGKARPTLQTQQEDELQRLIERRLNGVPLAHITCRQQFMGLEMIAGPEALIPRKETELLAQHAVLLLLEVQKRGVSPRVIDLCTGAANIAVVLALASVTATIYAADVSSEAVGLARKNIELHGLGQRVEAHSGDLFEPFETAEFYGNIDLITCNPPYISSGRVGEMDLEISSFEPSLAFDGGPFGISIISRVLQDSLRFLRVGGWLAFEVGLGQGESIRKRIERTKSYSQVVPVRDSGNNIRVILAQK